MLYIYTANVKDGQLKAFQSWASKNDERIRKVAPEGWKLRGIYFPVFGFGQALTEIHWDIENYAAFDAAHRAGSEKGPYFEVVSELYSFLDVRGQSARLLKEASDSQTLVTAE